MGTGQGSRERGIADRLGQVFAGRSQSEMSRRLGVSQANISRYMRGERPSVELLKALVRVEGVDIGWLLTGRRTPPPEGAKTDVSGLSDEQLLAELRRRAAAAIQTVGQVVAETEKLAEQIEKKRRRKTD